MPKYTEMSTINQAHAMSKTNLNAWFREKGLFEHQLKVLDEAHMPSDTGYRIRPLF
jgi:hypothetical protein